MVAHTTLSNRLKRSSEEADTTSVGSAFQGLAERTAKVIVPIYVLVCGLKNVKVWPLPVSGGHGAKNLSVCRFFNLLVIWKI